MNKLKLNMQELLMCISNAQDIVSPSLSYHHQKVAYLSYAIADYLELPGKRKRNIFAASLIHDIGSVFLSERLEIIESEPVNVSNHSFRGAKLIEGFKPLKKVSNIIRFHHYPWNYGDNTKFMSWDIPLESHIIHLADRICAAIKPDMNVLEQIPEIMVEISKKSGEIFNPALVNAIIDLGKKEYIWLDIISGAPVEKIVDPSLFYDMMLSVDDIIDLSMVFSHIIDFRSSFTAVHSAGVAKSAETLASFMGFSSYECKLMLIAGYLHDIGKLAIDNSILEKHGALNKREINEMRTHTYYTYHILDRVKEFETIKTWAAYHHERLDGNGYPFHINADGLSLGCRIMAVADIFSAITEDRPYRKGMSGDDAKMVLNNMVDTNAIDRNVVKILMDNFEFVNIRRASAQKEAAQTYSAFLDSTEFEPQQ